MKCLQRFQQDAREEQSINNDKPADEEELFRWHFVQLTSNALVEFKECRFCVVWRGRFVLEDENDSLEDLCDAKTLVLSSS